MISAAGLVNQPMVKRFWKRDGAERPPISFEGAVADLCKLNKGSITWEAIEERLRDGDVVCSPCAEYELIG